MVDPDGLNPVRKEITMMDFIREFEAYFPLEYRGIGEDLACFHVFPASQFTKQDFKEILTILQPAKEYTKTECTPELIRIDVDLKQCRELDIPAEEALEDIAAGLACGGSYTSTLEIGKLVLNDGGDLPVKRGFTDSADPAETEDTLSAFEWDKALGIDRLTLNFPAHAEGMEGECFLYSVYFAGGTAGQKEADAVLEAIRQYDFQLVGDDYIGYTSVTPKDGKISIYLDLGNTEPQNGDKIIHGILLALNNIQGIEKVIVNEDCDVY